jgi:AcrR family transcriptional regulator
MARRRSDIEPRIVRAARARFLIEGVDGASLRAIASDARTNIGMIYYYFKTKDDLFFAVVEETYSRLLDDLTRACDPALPAKERMRGVYRRIGAIDADESEVVRLVIREVLVSSQRLRRLIARFQRGHLALVMKTLVDGIGDGSIRDDLPPLILLAVAIAVGAIPQFMLNHVMPRIPGPRGDALADLLVEVLWLAISPGQRAAVGRRPHRKRGRA